MKAKNSVEEKIYVTTHVGRDLLQSASLFKKPKKVVWEYVSNGLEYVNEDKIPIVTVKLEDKKRCITVKDNGRGMDMEGLRNFFIMHGENIDRKRGKKGRGLFGTGKSAAFAIADVLRITTVRNKKRSIVELTKKDIKNIDSGEEIPIKHVETEEPCDESNGTEVKISKIHLKSLDQRGVIQFIERNLTKWPDPNATVIVNNHECERKTPEASSTYTFQPESTQRKILGDVQLIIKISGEPLEQELNGIAIFSNGFLLDTTLAGSEGRSMSHFIFGELDVPSLQEYEGPIAPFDMSRSGGLNPDNKIVQALMAFVGKKVDEVRRELVHQEKQRKATEESKKLANFAKTIAKVINEDFVDFRDRIAKTKAKYSSGFDRAPKSSLEAGFNSENPILGSIDPAIKSPSEPSHSNFGGTNKDSESGKPPKPRVEPGSSDDNNIGQPGVESKKRAVYRGGFHVEFKPMGAESLRATYRSPERTIYINTDHPQLVAAMGSGSIEDPLFLRLAYEVSFTEYAIALSHELNENEEFSETSDPIVEIRDTINRIAVKSASLYRI
jgi:hypothetical protein